VEAVVRTLPLEEILPRFDRIIAVYSQAFRPFPYNKGQDEVDDFARFLPDHLQDPGFRFAAAFQESDQEVVGFTYGRTSLPGQYWYHVVNEALAATASEGWLEDSFQVVEMAVVPAWQGQGIGGRLHDRLLEGISFPRALLTTLDGQTAASRLYQNRGWETLARGLLVPGLNRAYQIMGLRLPPLGSANR
jgi:GNAT superfamily N-acetyltransferase